MAYFDYAATAPLWPEAKAAMQEAYEIVGNPSASHAWGRKARALVEDAREEIAGYLGAKPREVIFTSGATEADILVTSILVENRPNRPKLLRSTIEHPAIAKAKLPTIELPVTPDGIIDETALVQLLNKPDFANQIGLASIMMANNETGVLQPISKLAEIFSKHDIWFHTDAVQGIAPVGFDFAATEIFAASISGHKIGGPVGIGALLLRETPKLTAPFWGGGQERELRSGTIAMPLILGFAAALRMTEKTRAEVNSQLVPAIQEFEQILQSLENVRINGIEAERHGRTVSVTIADLQLEELSFLLDNAGIYCATGSACHAGVVQSSPVLLAMGRSDNEALALRFSFGAMNTVAEIKELTETLVGIINRLRGGL